MNIKEIKVNIKGKRENEYTLEQLFNCHTLGMAVAFDEGFSFKEHEEALERFKEQIEQFVIGAIEQNNKEWREKIEGMKRDRQFPLAKEIKDRVYDCDVVAYNQALEDILKDN